MRPGFKNFAPWIFTRRRLIIAPLIDCTLFAVVHSCVFLWKFDSLPSISLFTISLFCFWCLGSYLFGRYSFRETVAFRLNSFIESAISTVGTFVSSLAFLVLALWLFRPTNDIAFFIGFRSYLIPFLIFFSLLSFGSQIAFERFLSNKNLRKYRWSILGTDEEFSRYCEEVKLSREAIVLEKFDDSFSPDMCAGIVLSSTAELDDRLFDDLMHIQKNGITTIVDYISWSELFLQRLPSSLLNKRDLIKCDFSWRRNTLQTRIKRIADVFVSLLLLIASLPLLVFLSILIKIEDGGPCLYSQIRTGYQGKKFRLFKLRTMKTNAEANGPQWSTSNDKRVTKIGNFLRSSRIDELPQLWSVLIGDMSLIGPRPERPEFDQFLVHELPYYYLRYQMRPGLSGWAQVNYNYGNTVKDAENKLSFDLFYLRNFSNLLDCLILIKTLKTICSRNGLAAPK